MTEIFDTKLMHPRDQISIIIDRIYKKGLTTTSGGNISIIDESGDIWITPSGIDKGSLKPSDIICVKKDGTFIGPHKPSSEYPFHKAIFDMRPDIKAIIHAHPPALVSFSIVRTVPNTNILSQAKQVCGPIGYAVYDVPGSQGLGEIIGREFAKGYMAVIMENHGTVLGGANMEDAYCRFETLEFSSRTILYSASLGTPTYLKDEEIEGFRKQVPSNLPEISTIVPTSSEREKRSEICRVVRRACDQGLMYSAYGTASIRTEGNDFLITPTDVSRWNIQSSDVVHIKDGKREAGKHPSRSVLLHQEIYRKNPGINSIIFCQAPYLMAFGASRIKFDVRTIPESWIFLQDVPQIPFSEHLSNGSRLADTLSKDTPAVIIQNESFVVTGDKLLQTFDKLEVAEFSAASIVMSMKIGQMVPINDEQVEDLRKVFLA